MQYTDELPVDPLTIHCYMDARGEASYTLYEDDGISPAYRDGAFAETLITCRVEDGSALVEIEERFVRYRPTRTRYEIVIHLADRTLTRRVQAGTGHISATFS